MPCARAVVVVSIFAMAAGCGGLLGFGADDVDPVSNVEDGAAAGSDGARNAEGGSEVEGGDKALEAGGGADANATDADAPDVMTRPDGGKCVAAGTCAKSVFDCCSEMEDPSAALCAGECGVDICCN